MGARALLLALCACAALARPGHASRTAGATEQEVLIQNIKEKLVTDNDDYVPNDNEREPNLVVNEAKFQMNDVGRNTAPTKPESTETPLEPARAPAELVNFRSADPKEHELDETQFEIAFDSNIARPQIKIVRKSHEVRQEPKIAQSQFEFDQLEPNTASPELDEPELNPVFAKLEPSFSQPEFNYAPDFNVDQLEPNTAPPETTHAQPEPTVTKRQFKFSQSEYAEFEFNIQSKYKKHNKPPIEPKETSAAEPEAENVPKEKIVQIEDPPTAAGQKTGMLEMVEDISEKTERRGRGNDKVPKSALRTNQIPNAHSPFHTEQVPNKRFVIQSSRFSSSTDSVSSPSATGREESRGGSGHTTGTESVAARRSTYTGATPEVVPTIVVYNFYPIPTGTGVSKQKKFKNKKVRETSRRVAELQRGRQSGRKAPRQRPRAEREGTVPKRPRRGGATRHPNVAWSGASKVRPRKGDRDGSSSERPRAGKRDGTTPKSSSSGVITFRYRAEIPLEVPLSRTWIENAFS